jgi:uncharacterized protein YjbI with pentapeptide repeats
MSEPSQEPGRIRRMSAGVSRWRNTRRGTKTLKAAYAKAASEVRRIDPVVRERIGRANLSKADLQQLATAHIAGRYGQQEHRDLSQRLDQAAASRVPSGRTNRFSRWRATRRGTKALKAAYAQAARDVKKMDAPIRRQIGQSQISRDDLQAMSRRHLSTVFRPEGRTGGPAPGPAFGPAPGAVPGAVAGAVGAQQPQQDPAQLDALYEQILQTAQLQLQATMLQNQRLQEIQQQLADLQQAQLQTTQPQPTQQPQVVPGQEPQVAQPEAGQPQPVPGQQPQVVAGQSGVSGPEAQNPDHVGQHAVVPSEPQAPAQTQPAPRQAQDPALARPEADVRSDWVASGTGQGNRQPAAQQPAPEQAAPAAQEPAAQPRVPAAQLSPRQQAAAAQAGPEQQVAAAANEQWTPNPQHGGPDMSSQNQADLKGEASKLHHVAFSGRAQPRIETADQARPAGERPAGNEAHRTSGPGTDRKEPNQR